MHGGSGASAGSGREGGAPLRAPLLAAAGALLLLTPAARATAGAAQADHLCQEATAAERDALELERNAERRARFLERAGRSPAGEDAGPGDAVALRASARGWIERTKVLLPQLREGAANARHDRGAVPGLGDYFARMEGELRRVIPALEACLDLPDRCSPPALSCPPAPAMPLPAGGGSAEFTRQVQRAYAQGTSAIEKACLDFNGAVRRDLERASRERRAAGAGTGRAAGAGGTDLYQPRIRALRRDAAQHRQEADRLSGVQGYCSARPRPPRPAPGGGRSDPGPSPVAKVVDLEASWSREWTAGKHLEASAVPLPHVTLGEGEAGSDRRREDRPEVGAAAPGWWREAQASREAAQEAGSERLRAWWHAQQEAYREADRKMELTEFIESRPMELGKDVVTELVEKLPYGKSVTTGYKILSAVKETSGEVMQIVVDAPRVLARGGAAETEALQGRADRVPLNLMSNLFDDVLGRFPKPRYSPKASADE